MTPADVHLFVGSRARLIGRAVLLTSAAVALLIVLGTRLVASPVQGAPTPPVSVLPASVEPGSPTGSGCWVTGDLVGDANPMLVAAAACGRPG